MVKLPVKILEEEGKTRTNVASFEIPAVTHFDGDVEEVLESLSALKTKVVKPRQLETETKEQKLTLKMMGLICSGPATQTLQDAAQAARKHVYQEYLETEYDIDEVQREVLIKDETAFEEYISREFDELPDELPKGVDDTEAFTKHLFKVFFQQFWNNLHVVMFSADTYRAYKTQKEYLKKPQDVGVEAAFQRVDTLTNLLTFFPPTGSRGRMATSDQWEKHSKGKFVSYAMKREMKYNLLPDVFQDRFDALEEDWMEMTHAKFNSEAYKCKVMDCQERHTEDKEKQQNKRKREEQLSNIPRKDRKKNERTKVCCDLTPPTNKGQARLCELCKAAGAQEYVYKTHWTSDCNKKEKYAKLMSGRAGSCQKAHKELSTLEKKLRREFKLMTKRVKQLEGKPSSKKRRRGEEKTQTILLLRHHWMTTSEEQSCMGARRMTLPQKNSLFLINVN